LLDDLGAEGQPKKDMVIHQLVSVTASNSGSDDHVLPQTRVALTPPHHHRALCLHPAGICLIKKVLLDEVGWFKVSVVHLVVPDRFFHQVSKRKIVIGFPRLRHEEVASVLSHCDGTSGVRDGLSIRPLVQVLFRMPSMLWHNSG
jgi:hypothetical protein